MPDVFVATTDSKKTLIKPQKGRSRHSLPGHSHNILYSFCYYPDHADFVNKDPQEEVVLLLRKHPITNLGWICLTVLMLFAPAILQIFPLLAFLPERFQLIAVVCWYLVTIIYAYEKFLTWFFNVNIITDERLIDVNFVNLVYRELTEAKIDKIQDTTVRMGSVIRTIFNYGDVPIQTAGEIPRITFEAVPRPDDVAKILGELIIEEEQEKIEGRVR